MDYTEWQHPNRGQRIKIPPLGRIVPIVIGVLVIWTILASVYTVPSDSVGVVLRFGKNINEVQPGLRFKIPWGIDSVIILPVRRQLKQEFGFGTPGATNPSQHPMDISREKRMVTGDLNSALVEWIVQYRIVGDRTVDEVLTIGRQEIEVEGLRKMQGLAAKYDVGVSIDQVQLKNVNPPEPVQESFNEVNQAQQEKEKLINDARREYNKSIPLAEGTKDQNIQEAEGYRLQRINEAHGDVSRFNSVLAQYLKAPEVTKRRIYLETMQEVLPVIRSKIVIDENARSVLPLLQLGGEKGGKP